MLDTELELTLDEVVELVVTLVTDVVEVTLDAVDVLVMLLLETLLVVVDDVSVVVGEVVAVEVGVLIWHISNGPSKYAFTALFIVATRASQFPATRNAPALQIMLPSTSGENSAIMSLAADAAAPHCSAEVTTEKNPLA